MKSLLTEKETALYLGMSISYLRHGRMKNGTPGKSTDTPDFYKLGKSIRYHVLDLQRWLKYHKVASSNDSEGIKDPQDSLDL